MTVRCETWDCEFEAELNSTAVIKAQPTNREDDTYEIITQDKDGNYMHIPVARIEIYVLPNKEGIIWEKMHTGVLEQFSKITSSTA